MKRIMAAAAALVLIFALAGCSESGSSSSSSEQTQSSESVSLQAAPVGKEPDVMAAFTDGSGDELIGMSKDEFDKATGGCYTEQNSISHSEDNGKGYTKISLGKSDSILGGRVKLGKEYDIVSAVAYKDNKITKLTIDIENITKEEADVIGDNFIKAFDGKLPEGYKQFTPVEHGSKREVGFTKGIHDYCFSVNRDKNLDDEYFASFAIQKYDERYGM